MAGKRKLDARAAFDDNLADAHTLVKLAKALRNNRQRRMRRELRERLGEALGIKQRDWDDLDCTESDDLFAVFKPRAAIGRELVSDDALRPLLRQALVAACAALETFVGDRAMERMGQALKASPQPTRLQALPMTVGDWFEIEDEYDRRQWGIRKVVELEVRRLASPAPGQIGIVFSLVGEKELWKRVDKRRAVARGKSEAALTQIYERRNRIAHQGDRSGRGRASITAAEVDTDLACLLSVVDALDVETRG